VGDKKNDWTREELQREYVDKMTAVTVPVHVTIHGQQTILDLSSMEDLLRNAEVIALEDCGCRTKWHKCDAPADVCISLDDGARDSMKRGARRISLAQALVALQRSHRAGLVHMAFTFRGKDKPEVICSCCSCCCHSLSALVRFGMPDAVVASKYIAQQNRDTCNNCGTCVKRCQFKARQLDPRKILVFDPAKCFGCGLCLSTCPTRSIKLVTRTTVDTEGSCPSTEE
jgi:ferredoxin